MKFRSESSNLIVWNPQKGKELCRFKDHELETEDEYICKKLIDLGYEHNGQEKTEGTKRVEPKSVESDTLEDLRKEAKEKGIKGWNNMKYENLIEKLKGDSHAKSI